MRKFEIVVIEERIKRVVIEARTEEEAEEIGSNMEDNQKDDPENYFDELDAIPETRDFYVDEINEIEE